MSRSDKIDVKCLLKRFIQQRLNQNVTLTEIKDMWDDLRKEANG